MAGEAGYTTGAVYSNFASKEDLFFAVYERRAEAAVRHVERSIRELGPATALERLGWTPPPGAVATTAGLRCSSTLGARRAQPRARARFAEIHTRASKPIADAVQRLTGGGEGPMTASAVTAAMNVMQIGLALERLTRLGLVDPDLLARTTRLVLADMERAAPDAGAGANRPPASPPGRLRAAVRLARELAGRERLRSGLRASSSSASSSSCATHASACRSGATACPPAGFASPELPTLDKAQLMESFDDLVADRRLRRDELLAHLDGADRDELYLDEYRVLATIPSGRKGLYVYGREGWSGSSPSSCATATGSGMPRLPRLRVAAVGGASPTHMTQRGGERRRRSAPHRAACGHAAPPAARRGAEPLRT